MALSVDYIASRHAWWLGRIAGAGVWNVAGMDRVNFKVRPQARTINGKFVRKVIGSRNPLRRSAVVDTIIIYDNPWLDSELKIDSVIVHEMIHQYIAVARLRDSSSHGRLFRSFMETLNRRFAGEIDLHVSTRAEIPVTPATRRKNSESHLLAIVADDRVFYCCRVMNSAFVTIDKLLKRLKSRGQISRFGWYASGDERFDRLSGCRTRLHGLRQPLSELDSFLVSHSLTELSPDLILPPK